MSLILSQNRCPHCGRPMVRDPLCSGDYYNTVHGYVLQEYCNGDCSRNGFLRPVLSGRDPDFISNSRKKHVATKVAYVYRMGMIETKNIAKNIETNNIHEWIRSFSKEINISIMDVEHFTLE